MSAKTSTLSLESKEFATVAEFLQVLDRPGDWGPPDFRSPWVFRGHGNAEWDLKPSAWRADGQAKLKPLREWLRPRISALVIDRSRIDYLGRPDPVRAEEKALQLATEAVAVRQFCELADELGMEVPDGDEVPEIDEALHIAVYGFGRTDSGWIGSPATPLFHAIPFSLAQHHGIPTRYLDWTRDPMIAAYFAAEGALRSSPGGVSKTGSLCVWATKVDYRPGNRLSWITAPRSRHHYLHAQNGLFSFDTGADAHFDQHGRWPSFQDGTIPMTNPLFSINKAEEPVTLVAKLSLPGSCADELLQFLFRKRISRAHLMPTFDNVAMAVGHRWDWYGKWVRPSRPNILKALPQGRQS